MNVKTIVVASAASLVSVFFTGCKSDAVVKPAEKSPLSRVNTTFKYVQVTEIGVGKVCSSAVVSVNTAGENPVFSLTIGSFCVEKNGEVFLRATEKAIACASLQAIANEIAIRAIESPVSIFMIINGQTLGTQDYTLDGTGMALLRDFEKELAGRGVEYVYLIPDKLTISEI